ACQPTAHVIGVAGQADPATLAHFASDSPRLGGHFDGFGSRWIVVDHNLERFGSGEFEPPYRRHITDPLMRTLVVVFDHPPVDSRLGLLQALESLIGEEVLLQSLVEPLHLPRSRRGTRRRDQVY